MFRTRLYYRIKPLLPPSLRMSVRRWFALRKREQVLGTWPILPGSEKPPAGWPGWPDGKKFAFVITHDVEGPEGLAKCRQLMELEMKLGFRSSFNFIPEGDYAVPPALRTLLVENGFEVGVHDLHHDGKLYRSRADFARHATRINHYLKDWGAVGFRSGFMLHNLDWLHDLNVAYDSSTFDTDPFEPQPDGVSTIFPFWVEKQKAESRKQKAEIGRTEINAGEKDISAFNFSPRHSEATAGQLSTFGNSPIARSGPSPTTPPLHHSTTPVRPGYVELPYTLPQDSTLFLLFAERHPDIWFQKLGWIAKHGGMAMLPVHPDYMNFKGSTPNRGGYSASLYEETLQFVTRKFQGQYWLATPREVAEWYRSIRLESNRVGTDKRAQPAALKGKRAAVVLYSYYPSDPRPRREAEALANAGMEVDLICLRQNPGEAACEAVNGVNVRRVPIRRRRDSKLTYILQYASFLAYCTIVLAYRTLRKRYDLVHVHNMPDVLVFSGLIPKLRGARILLDLHDPMPELMMTIFGLREDSFAVRLLKRFEKQSIRFANQILTVNLACKKIFASRSCPPGKITVIMNSPDEQIFQFRAVNGSIHDSPNPFAIMYHGSIVERHGLDLAFRALEIVRKTIPHAELRVYGARTPFLDSMMDSVRNNGLRDVVHYLGAKTLEEIVEAIEKCDVGIIPNRRNVFTEINTPTRIFEYLSRAKPVVAPRAPGIEDYFDKEDLVFFELGDADDLARKIEYVYFHSGEIREIIGRGQQVYLDHKWSCEKLGFVNVVGDLLTPDAVVRS